VTDEREPRVAVVGGGFAGAAFALHLVRANGRRPIAIDIYEPRPLLGAGLAYSSADPSHRINVAAARMAVFAEDPTHFDRWFKDTGEADADPAALLADGRAYPRRAAFGRYMDHLLRTAAAAFPNVRFRHRRAKVTDVAPKSGAYRLTAEDGAETEADLVVLSPGHPPPSQTRWVTDEAARAPRYVGDPWRLGALTCIRLHDEVLIIGTGLTMADVVASLRAQGHHGPITAISRRGLTPRPRTTLPVEAYGTFDRPPTGSAATLLQRVRSAVRKAAQEGKPWECVVDALRQQGTAVWQGLSPESRRRFLRHLRTWWDVHRYQIAPQIDDVLRKDLRSGRLKIIKADIQTIARYQGSFHVSLRQRGPSPIPLVERFFDAVVNCTGPDHGSIVQSNPLLCAMAERGLLRGDPNGLGIAVDRFARVIGADDAPVPNLFVAGPLARGYFGELMGLPQVSLQPERLAAHLADLLQASETEMLTADRSVFEDSSPKIASGH
jgi:uncharacterized NAD(P)/FAD-binding protein YdhS